ncbi:hypothetical protein Q5752_001262 [Cryptotrichosporon argae]
MDPGDATPTPARGLSLERGRTSSPRSAQPSPGPGSKYGAPVSAGNGAGAGTSTGPGTPHSPHYPSANDIDRRAGRLDIGYGRPRGPSVDARPNLRRHPTSPTALTGSPLPHAGRAGSIHSYSSSDDECPHTAMDPYGETTPRLGPTRPPHTAAGSTFGNSPLSSYNTAPRPSRVRNNTTLGLASASGTGSLLGSGAGSMSRSTSRARPPIPLGRMDDGAGVGAVQLDRGEDLIRRRQAERRAAKQRERDRRLAEEGGETDDTPMSTAPPSGVPETPGLAAQQQRSAGGTVNSAISRAVSRSRVASARGPSLERRPTGSVPLAPGSVVSRSGSVSDLETPLSPRDEMFAARDFAAPSEASQEDDEFAQMAERAPSVIEEVVREEMEDEQEAGSEGERDEADDGDEPDDDDDADDEGVTLRDRQDAINIEHPFGLPIWKPALYRKSRTVTRNAESALHLIPSAAAERHLLPGNLLWVVLFGWWLALTCAAVAIVVSALEALGGGRGGYGKTLRGLAWYIGWPFGKYVEGEGPPVDHEHKSYGATDDNDGSEPSTPRAERREPSDPAASVLTVRQRGHAGEATRDTVVSFVDSVNRPPAAVASNESAPLLIRSQSTSFQPRNNKAKLLGRLVYWPAFVLVIAPALFVVCALCWGLVFTIPMAKLTWALIKLLYSRPHEINFRSAPKVAIPSPSSPEQRATCDAPTVNGVQASSSASGSDTLVGDSPSYTIRRARLTAGQIAPTAGPTSTVLLCVYRAVGGQYYKYTVGGVNILFINLVPLVFFAIIDGLLILPFVERMEHHGQHVSPLLAALASPAVIFVLALASVIPLSYFIGMAVASISAQSSIGMGAVINATFGSVIEIILYGIALTQGKGRLVEGSIVGSILAGVLLMPGASMCSGALKRKEQKFNAKSAGVTSTMLIMAIIGTLTPTMFYQTYGTFELHCEGCPEPRTLGPLNARDAWMCDHCYYEHPDPANDLFYQEKVKTLMYACAGILLFSYLIGLWFSLRTHASQIWQNPQQLMVKDEPAPLHPSIRHTLAQRLTPANVMSHVLPLHNQQRSGSVGPSRPSSPRPGRQDAREPLLARDAVTREARSSLDKGDGRHSLERDATRPSSPLTARHDAAAFGTFNSPGVSGTGAALLPPGFTPLLESVPDLRAPGGAAPIRLPSSLTTDDFTRAVAAATVSALRHQRSLIRDAAPAQKRMVADDEGEGEGGGHEAPSWTRGVSAGVLLACTLLYAIIAEILVDVVDVVLNGSGLDEKFLGLTLFALVPNTTEFMNAMSFAMNGNIALSMEIGSAYALQVCLLQIPAMVAFSALYEPGKVGDMVDTFTLIFPRWDVIAIILSIFLLTYTYIEARSNYHRGSILVLAYVVLIMGFYYAPPRAQGDVGSDTYLVSATVADAVGAAKAGWSILWV